MKKALMLRMGGLGDILILTPVAKALHSKGYSVDFWCGSPTGDVHELIKGLPYLNDVRKLERIAGVHDCIIDNDGNKVSVEIEKAKYDEVFDFKFSVEGNFVGLHKNEGWRSTINSNYQNWIDLSLSWCGIDPQKVSAKDKRPEIILGNIENSFKYIKWVNEETPLKSKLQRNFKVIGIQLQASSLIRSWYKAGDLPDLIHKKYPNDVVMVFAGKWVCITPNGREGLQLPEGFNPLTASASLISEMDCFISADTGTSHIGEAVNTPTITCYTTVPAWTREKYYKYSYPIEATPECFPCFTLDTFCPLEKKKAEESLTEREKDLVDGAKNNRNPMDYAKKYNVPPKAIEMEFNAIGQKLQAIATTEPACVKSITADMILNKIDEVLGGVHQRGKTKILNFQEKVAITEIKE